jgi:hypothetical protein
MESGDVSRLSMGNALRRLSIHIYNDLKRTLAVMQNQDPELRTIELRRFIFRTRKIVIQMMSVTKFLLSEGVTTTFRGFDDFQFRIDRINQVLARNIEEQQHSCSDIVIARSRPYNIRDAMDLMSAQASVDFPLSVLSCGLPPPPVLFPSQTVISDLNIYIRAKLFFIKALLPSNCQFDVRDGAMEVVHTNYYRLRLTLTALDECAEWKILECRLLVAADSEYMGSTDRWDWSTIESELVVALKRVLTAPTTSVDPPTSEEAGESIPATYRQNADNTASQKPPISLLRVIRICEHVSAAARLRVLHRQSIQYVSKGVLQHGSAVVEYNEHVECSQLLIGFWRSEFSE